MKRHILLAFLAAGSSLVQAHPKFKNVPGNDFGISGDNATFDYVVVGGGTAGLALAYRLAEDGTQSVAVIEAGGFYAQDGGNVSVVPAYAPRYANTDPKTAKVSPLVDWGFVTQAQQGLGGRELKYARGKTLGGSSVLNGMLYNRGTIGSSQVWADLVGDDSWSFENILPFFARGVTYSPANAEVRPANASVPLPANPLAFNGSGPLEVSHPNYAQPFDSHIDAAMEESGIPIQQDFSSGSLLGRQYAPATVSYPDEERSTSQAYLDRARHSGRENLKVYPNTLARRVVFDSNMTATGVEVEASVYGNSKVFYLTASKETILSAGAFQSPQPLMVSGVGPREQLEAHGIEVLADRPGVGTGMQDHLDFASIWEIEGIPEAGVTDEEPYGSGQLIEEYRVNRTGALTSAPVVYLGWEKLPETYRGNLSVGVRADLAEFPADWPELEYEVGATRNLFGASDPSKHYGTIICSPVAPLSRGWVSITSNSTRDLPAVNPNQLSHPTDRELAVQAFKRIRSFFETEAMKPFVVTEASPGLNVTSDEAILEHIMGHSFQNWHASCTCRMGRTDDPMAVVDSKARVIGVNGLRVVDASSFALLPPGHPQSTVYLMAEKIAADILATA